MKRNQPIKVIVTAALTVASNSLEGILLLMPSPRIEKFALPLVVPASSRATLGIATDMLVKSRIFKARSWSEP